MNNISLFICAHLCGDFLLQNDWMQRKHKISFVCSVHVACYSLPFVGLCLLGHLPWMLFAVIIAEHWLQDRFGLHLKWMRLAGTTPPDKWPVGPLCLDQAMHLTFMAIASLFLK